jgi:aminoglycoside phosphotransferase (APT) family kinase protein
VIDSETVARALGLSPAQVIIKERPALAHQSNRLYNVYAGERHLILKEYLKPDEWDDAPRREFRALQLMAPLDLAPRPVFYEPATPSQGPRVAYEFMEGEMWDRRKPTPAELAQLADVWLKLNAVPTEGLWFSRNWELPSVEIETRFRTILNHYAEWAQAEFQPGRPAAELCLAALERGRPLMAELDEMQPPLCFCRSDSRFANIIRRPSGNLGLIDWEDSGLRDPARDVADLLLAANEEDLLTPAEWRAFLDPYCAAHAARDPALPRRVQLYLPLFCVFWLALIVPVCLQQLQNGRPAEWNVNGQPASLRLRRYLARAQAWPNEDFSKQLAALQDLEFFPACES